MRISSSKSNDRCDDEQYSWDEKSKEYCNMREKLYDEEPDNWNSESNCDSFKQIANRWNGIKFCIESSFHNQLIFEVLVGGKAQGSKITIGWIIWVIH